MGNFRRNILQTDFRGKEMLNACRKKHPALKKKDLLRSGLDPRSRFALFLIETLSITGQKFPTSL